MPAQGVTMTGAWQPLGKMLARGANPIAWRVAKEKAIVKEAHRIRKIIIQGFNNGGPAGARWKRLSPMTNLIGRTKGKGDRTPLKDTGGLRNSISVVQEGDGWFVGVHKTARGKGKRGRDKAGRFTKASKGSLILGIAEIHEYGSNGTFKVKVSDKMRRYFKWLHKKTKGDIKPLKPSTTEIIMQIPARPFIGPVWDKEQDQSSQNIINGTLKNIGLLNVSNII